MDTTEIAIIGASFAGLSAALTLGRSRREVVVVGDGPPRNEPAQHAHTFLTRDGASPADLHAAALADVDRYPTVTRVDGRAVTLVVDPDVGRDGGFVLELGDGARIAARRVVLATGVRDVLPAIDGLADLWGRRAHFCPYCDGYEYADRRLAVVGDDPRVGHLATMLRQWTDRVTVFANPAVAGLELPADVDRVDAAVSVAERDGDVVVRTGGDAADEVAVDGVFVAQAWLPRSELAAQVGAEIRDGYVVVDGEQATSVPGLWAAGDVAFGRTSVMMSGGVAQAVGAGNRAATALNGALILGDAAAAAASASQTAR
jgi:thioredoxin reductase